MIKKLLAEINKQAIKQNKMIACLLQVHIATEETKFGFDAASLTDFMASGRLSNYSNIVVKGLMGMASFTEDKALVEKEFIALKNIYDQTATQLNNVHFDTLSMGMSGDYALAIEKGSNVVRIGSLLFGVRN